MDKDIKEILELEKEAESIIKKAEKKAETLAMDSNAELIKLRSEYQKRIEKRKEDALKKTETELKKKRESILSEGIAEKKKMSAKAEKNMDKAVDYIIAVLKKK
jgi:vacuolar-type H+-ATPase subunit H